MRLKNLYKVCKLKKGKQFMKIELISFFDEIDFGFEINFIKEFHRRR